MKTHDTLLKKAQTACARIAPLWPLEHFVAVNPFVGLVDRPFADACDLIGRLAEGGMQMPLNYYSGKFEANAILEVDLAAALARARKMLSGPWAESLEAIDAETLKSSLKHSSGSSSAVSIFSIAEAVDKIHKTDWLDTIQDSIGQFCAAYFDKGQSAWQIPWKTKALFPAWRALAEIDANWELLGLSEFRRLAAALPTDADSAICQMFANIPISESNAEDYFHKLLITIRGWAGHIQYNVREKKLEGQSDHSLLDLLAIRLAFDHALLNRYDSPELRTLVCRSAKNTGDKEQILTALLWQLADENAWQRSLIKKLCTANRENPPFKKAKMDLQAVFCIDVRSEVFRRALESCSPRIQTVGFAGFFAMPIEYLPVGGTKGSSRCPVLLTPSVRIRETLPCGAENRANRLQNHQYAHRQINYAWNSFKTSAISCFSFVETAGLSFGLKLIRESFLKKASGKEKDEFTGFKLHAVKRDPLESKITLEDRVQLALGALRNMGLTKHFARVVLLCGHGSETENNPYGSSLDCGACGGHPGDTNARVAVGILNEKQVRIALLEHGIEIPDDTWFVAGLHNTTTDQVTLLDLQNVPTAHLANIRKLREHLATAGQRAREERAISLGLQNSDPELKNKIVQRGRDWAQVRPEWGLAGNAAFIAAPRVRTITANLQGRVFLHDYDYQADPNSKILELIMTAPMIVANWINLQYFASTVNNPVFGSGNKVIHNVVGTIGVFQGNSGDLQTGLPLQSLHNGEKWVHEPLRLHVFLEAPREKIDAVLEQHEAVRQLVDHGWLLLFSIEDQGLTYYRYLPCGGWEQIETAL